MIINSRTEILRWTEKSPLRRGFAPAPKPKIRRPIA